MRVVAWVSCWIVIGTISQSEVACLQAQERRPASSEEFLKEYPAAARRLQEFYTSLQMTEIQKQITPEGVKPIREREFRANGQSLLLKTTNLQEQGRQTVLVTTPERSFWLVKEAGRDKFKVLEAGAEPSRSDRTSIQLHAKLPFAPYAVLDLLITEVLANPTFKITRVERLQKEGRELLQVFWECRFGNERKHLDRAGDYVFSPSEAWVLREYAIGVQGNPAGRMRCAIEYDKEYPGIPLVKQARYWKQQGDKIWEEEIVERADVTLEPAPPKAFTGVYFGRVRRAR